MTVTVIFSVILLFALGVLFIPLQVDLEYSDDFKFKLSFLKITLYKSGKKKEAKGEKTPSEGNKSEKKKNSVLEDAKKYFSAIKAKEGFVGAVREAMALVSEIFSHIKGLLRFVRICGVRLNITVGAEDAAKTAVDYGLVCSAVYPVTAFLDSAAHIGFKEISIRADFEEQKCDFGFKGKVRVQVFYLALCAFRIYKALKNFINGENENER